MGWDINWTDADQVALNSFKDAIDCDDIKIKEDVKGILLNNRFIVHALYNKDLAKSEPTPDEYFGVNILPYYLIPDDQSNVKNYLCYEVSYEDLNRYNSSVKTLELVFYILCHKGIANIIDQETGIARHDLLAALVQDQFNFNPHFRGGKMRLVSDVASTTDTNYATRTLTFQQTTDNNLVKSKTSITSDLVPRLANKEFRNEVWQQQS